ncbi:TetR/AcrR family transcriptional regulator [Ruminiclostridium cellobioparum]|jgi:AcrR family transcriptional regulator|uniref:TetR/AcrR family transcriptional regulator n=1 Tax=Ruminiclostridium cellobioparum TaxID=29355 RepID=UPI00047FDB6A|nr:TetR/AcrR family transcriptional regulator [Ruminiclostridium cellobioparum]
MIEKKPNLKKLQGLQTKKNLYESARKLLTTREISDVSVEDITRSAGVSKGTFFVHYPSKDALIVALLADETARVDLDYKGFLESLSADMSASGIMLAFTEKIATVITDTIGYDTMKVVYQIQLTKTVPMETVMGYSRKLYAMFSELLEQGIRQGEFQTALPLDTLSRHFVMAIRGICYEWCIRYPDFDLKEQAVAHMKLLLKGIMS